ncbi:MAG: TIM barrel protein [Planctomycetota bacterium]
MRFGIEAGEHTMTLANELSFNGVPINGHDLVGDGDPVTPLRDAGLDVCQIGMFDFNPMPDGADDGRLREVIAAAAGTGCRHIVVGPGNYNAEGAGFAAYDPRNRTDDALDRMAGALRPLCELVEKHDALLCIEAYLKGVVYSADSFSRLAEKVASPALRCNVDPSSLYDFADVIDPAAKVAETCDGLAGRYGVVHLKEVGLDDGFHLHMGLKPIGAGTTDWKQMLSLVNRHAAADDWLIVEHVGGLEEGRRSYALITEAAEQVGLALA